MDYIPKIKTEPEINLIDAIWGLLTQWKAVFAFSIIIAMLLTGFRYYKDINAYKAGIKNQEEKAAAMSELSPEEQINNILENLSEGDRLGVEYVVKQKEWVEKEREYLRDSILLNTNPTNQRTLILDYFIANSDANTDAVKNGYWGFVTNKDLIEGLKQVISPASESNIISELVSVRYNVSGGALNAEEFVLEIQVVLPDEVDSGAVADVVTTELNKYSERVKKEIGDHDLKMIGSSEARYYNQAAVDRRTNINVSTYNMNYNLGNLESSLSEEQRVAMNSILEINRLASEAEEGAETNDSEEIAEEIPKPGLNKKYMLLGFVMGLILYAIVYILISALKGNITSSEQTEHYSDSRLLGDVYYKGTYKGLKALLHSSVVEGLRYRSKKDTAKQLSKITATVNAICKKNNIDKVVSLCLPGISDADQTLLNQLQTSIQDKGIDIEIADVDFDTIEEKLLTTDCAICVANEEAKATDLINITELFKSYDTKMMGNIYIKSI